MKFIKPPFSSNKPNAEAIAQEWEENKKKYEKLNKLYKIGDIYSYMGIKIRIIEVGHKGLMSNFDVITFFSFTILFHYQSRIGEIKSFEWDAESGLPEELFTKGIQGEWR